MAHGFVGLALHVWSQAVRDRHPRVTPSFLDPGPSIPAPQVLLPTVLPHQWQRCGIWQVGHCPLGVISAWFTSSILYARSWARTCLPYLGILKKPSRRGAGPDADRAGESETVGARTAGRVWGWG
jgi:hypothetical protein